MPNRKGFRNAFVYLLILVILVAIFLPIFIRPESGTTIDIGTLLDRAQKGEISTIEVQGDSIVATLASDPKTQPIRRMARPVRQFPATAAVRRLVALHDAPRPERRQPSLFVWEEPRPHVRRQ
jgi:antitoxin (DNA-binding transcriptional repressor) of toxin-antitoxin stability system